MPPDDFGKRGVAQRPPSVSIGEKSPFHSSTMRSPILGSMSVIARCVQVLCEQDSARLPPASEALGGTSGTSGRFGGVVAEETAF